MPKKGVLRGTKVSKQHSTYTKTAEQVILAAKAHPEVKKIALGPITSVSGGAARVSLRDDNGQVRVQCRDIGSVQILWVIGLDVERLRDHLKTVLKCDVV